MVPLNLAIFCDGWARENKFLKPQNFRSLLVPHWGQLSMGVDNPKSYIYDLSTLHAKIHYLCVQI